MTDYSLSYSWEIDDEHQELTLKELTALAVQPGGMLDDALFEHHVMVTGEAAWEIDTATDQPRLRVVVPVAPWHSRRDPLPPGHPMREVAA